MAREHKSTRRQPRECMCGCGETTKGGKFLPGHDAKLKSQLLTVSRSDEAAAPERKKARAKLRRLGWT